MTDERYQRLMADDSTSENLMQHEIRQGWHFCCEFDGLLIGPGMGETKFCHCYDAPSVGRGSESDTASYSTKSNE